VTEWHINADEPSVLDYNTDFKSPNLQSTLYNADQYRISDHDPIIIGLDLLAYDFDGFYPPAGMPSSNADRVNAARTLPVKFGLGGDRGLGVLLPEYPTSVEVDCGTRASLGSPSPTKSDSELRYDPADDQYIYTWKTDRAWHGTCRALTLAFADGTSQTLFVSFR
jgi:hypothetical protein